MRRSHLCLREGILARVRTYKLKGAEKLSQASDDEILSRMEEDLLSDSIISERVKEFGASNRPSPVSDEASQDHIKESTLKLSLRRLALSGLLVLVAFALVFTGVSVGYSVLGVSIGLLGVLLMMCGVYLALSPTSQDAKNRGGVSRKSADNKESFGDRQRRKFKQRYQK